MTTNRKRLQIMSFEYREEGRGRQLRGDHSKFIHEVIHALKHTHISMEEIFGDDRWNTVDSTMSHKRWTELCESLGYSYDLAPEDGASDDGGPYEHILYELLDMGHDLRISREFMLALVEGVAPTLKPRLRAPLSA